MSAADTNSTTKKFGKGERTIPHHSQKGLQVLPSMRREVAEEGAYMFGILAMRSLGRWSCTEHPTYSDQQTRKSVKPTKYRETLQLGAILILLADRFRGKRVVLPKQLDQDTLLVTGPFKINGVPLRRKNARHVIATSTKVDLSEIDSSALDKVSKPEYFVCEKKSKSEKGEEAFFKQGEKSEAKKPTSARASDQKSIDKPILSATKKQDLLASYLASNFRPRHGQRPHAMQFWMDNVGGRPELLLWQPID